ncbi:helix-turn-helix domain-containing protein [Planomonospora sp. ID91781]|uniref:XRE family transcriptional regulator n=1 Tax=Planomonospora sphaerica TaxID=161355 RepID=A0A161M7R7_9ACTN|nr:MULTISPECIES: helix-turn-helix domain-containing protein [Planomonospora]MBG0821841.1 helix-turn-helix domain-containing protein [Planomonospora sp. ID91781]GAT65043.1 XRE family transcriptional regulator [Planomonospora sphaerica]
MAGQDLVGQRIKTMRRQRGLSQAQLAHPELSDSYVSLIESGKRTPTPAVLELLAQKLDCSLTYLINGVTTEQMREIELGLGYARLAMENGEVVEARTRYAELLADEGLAGLPQLRQETEYGLALASRACGDLDAAISLLIGLRERDGSEISPERHIDIVTQLSICYREQGRLAQAVQVVEEILGGAVRPAWTDGLIRLGVQALAAYIERGDLLRARHFSAELVAAAETLGTPTALTLAYWEAAILAFETGCGEEAAAYFERAVAIQSEHGEAQRYARLRVAHAVIMIETRPEEAASWRDLLMKVEKDLGESPVNPMDKMRCAVGLARAELLLGSPQKAELHIRSVLAMLDGMPEDLQADAHLVAGQTFAELGRAEEGTRELAAAAALLEPLPVTRYTSHSWLTAARILERIDETDRSVEAYQRALACAGL